MRYLRSLLSLRAWLIGVVLLFVLSPVAWWWVFSEYSAAVASAEAEVVSLVEARYRVEVSGVLPGDRLRLESGVVCGYLLDGSRVTLACGDFSPPLR